MQEDSIVLVFGPVDWLCMLVCFLISSHGDAAAPPSDAQGTDRKEMLFYRICFRIVSIGSFLGIRHAIVY